MRLFLWVCLAIVVLGIVVFLVRYGGYITYALRQVFRERHRPPRPAGCRPRPRQWRDDQITVSWLGHATLLINFHGVRIITDPVFFENVGIHVIGRMSVGPRRLVECALPPEELPTLDLIVQSHAHMDHLDVRSWKTLPRQTHVVMAVNNSRHIRRLGFQNVTELHWGQTTEAGGVRVTAIQTQHWGERFPWNEWHGHNAYLLERNGHAILFGGDTAYTDGFRTACGNRRIQLAILPIGGYQPWIHAHASPEQAWKMFEDLGADYLAPIHHQTFVLSHEPPGEPIERMLTVAGERKNRVVLREVGATFVVP